MINGGGGKSDIWRINAEGEYHEEIGSLRILDDVARPAHGAQSSPLALQ